MVGAPLQAEAHSQDSMRTKLAMPAAIQRWTLGRSADQVTVRFAHVAGHGNSALRDETKLQCPRGDLADPIGVDTVLVVAPARPAGRANRRSDEGAGFTPGRCIELGSLLCVPRADLAGLHGESRR